MNKNHFDNNKFREWVKNTPEAQRIFTEDYMKSKALLFNPEKKEFWIAMQTKFLTEDMMNNKWKPYEYPEVETLLNEFLKSDFGVDFMSTPKHPKRLTFFYQVDNKAPLEYKLYVSDDIVLIRNGQSVTYTNNPLSILLREYGCYLSDFIHFKDITPSSIKKHICQYETEMERLRADILIEIDKIIPLNQSTRVSILVDFGDYFKDYEDNYQKFINIDWEVVRD